MSHFSPAISLRLGIINFWKFNWTSNTYNALDLYLRLKYFLLKNNIVLIGYKFYKFYYKTLLYVVYFKYAFVVENRDYHRKDRFVTYPPAVKKIKFYKQTSKKFKYFYPLTNCRYGQVIKKKKLFKIVDWLRYKNKKKLYKRKNFYNFRIKTPGRSILRLVKVRKKASKGKKFVLKKVKLKKSFVVRTAYFFKFFNIRKLNSLTKNFYIFKKEKKILKKKKKNF